MSEINDDAMTCQRRRAEAARVVEPEDDDIETCPEGHERGGNTYVDSHGHLVCNACRRAKWAAKRYEKRDEMLCATTVFGVIPGVADGKMGRSETASDLTPKPPLSTPTVYRKEAVDS
jgi:hypothetical protein